MQTAADKIITYSFCESFLERFVDDLDKDYVKPGRDLSRLAIVFGGKRPALFVRQALAGRIQKPFYPPRFFSIDEFMGYAARREKDFAPSREMDQYYFIYQAAKDHCPGVLRGRHSFADFLPWAQEILSFIDQLDLECVADERLLNIEKNAAIGYEVPQDINLLLQHIVTLRQVYHQHMEAECVFSRGMQYRKAAEGISSAAFPEFDEILFANFFYFNRAEEEVVKELYRRGQARLFFQGDQRRWPVFKRIAQTLDIEIKEADGVQEPKFDLKLYQGFDMHSQIAQVRDIIQTVDHPDRTVIIVPDPESVIPLLSQVGPLVKDFNVSMGYPLKRSSLVSLLEQMFAAQESRDDRGYYTQDYLKVLKHPLVKNLQFHENAQVVRVLIHKIEEVLSGRHETPLSGCVFVSLEQMVQSADIISFARETLSAMEIEVSDDGLREVIRQVHNLCFDVWESLSTFGEFADGLFKVLDIFGGQRFLDRYPLNIRIAFKLFDIADECAAANFSREPFPKRDLFRIFLSKVDREIVAFDGSPLKGLQILGLFETRSLNFDHVIVLDVNEGILPRLNVYQPLIPRDVMISLNLDRLEQEEEIQRYGFMRLVSSAKTVHLIYQQSRERERSRFIEELVWQSEKKVNNINVVPVSRIGFDINVQSRKRVIEKTAQMIDVLKDHCYSASSINLYLRDPLEFCYRYVFGLQDQEDLLDEPENRQVGTFLHEWLKKIFEPFVNRKPVLDQSFVRSAVRLLEKEFDRTFGRTGRPDTFFLKHIIDQRMTYFLEEEARRCHERVEQVMFIEQKFEDEIDLPAGKFKFVYKVDRVDRLKDGSILLLDYKTGSAELMPKALEEIEAGLQDSRAILETVRSFQLPLYLHYLHTMYPGERIDAGFYNLRDGKIHRFLSRRTGSDHERIEQVFLTALNAVFQEMLDSSIPFVEGE